MTKRQKNNEGIRAKNRLLEITRFSIPYIKELKNLPLVKSTNACILMTQIEYWTALYPKGFYKFQSRPLTTQYAYKEGDSWTEELNISEEEFRTAFDQIGVRYNSKKAYDQARDTGDEFSGRYYCSYFNKVRRTTHYFRNDEAVEKAIDSLVEMQNSVSRDGDSSPTESTILTSRNGETGYIEGNNTGLESTENTPNTKTENISEREKIHTLSDIDTSFWNEGKNEEEKLGMEITLPSNSGSNSSPDKDPQTKIVIPENFSPTWEAKYQAVLHFPHKSVAWATDKFITYYEAKGSKLTIEQWHQKWWDWMQTEREIVGSEELDNEHFEIINHIANDVFACTYKMEDYIFDIDSLQDFLNFRYSEKTLTDVLRRLYEVDSFGKIGDCYFNNAERKEWWSEIANEIRNKEMLDDVIDIRSLPEKKASLGEILEWSEKREQGTVSI